MGENRFKTAEKALSDIIGVLASTLIRLDLTPTRLAQISRAAFVMTASTESRMKSGRPHIARIAARVGLSRSEVKRIISSHFNFGERDPSHAPRAMRVMEAWKAFPRYSRKGKPRILKIGGAAPSFESLCREHSGDIPYRVILDELTSRGFAKISAQHKLVTLTEIRGVGEERKNDLEALRYVAVFLTDAMKGDDVLVRRRIRISAPDTITDRYFEGSVSAQISNVVDGLPSLASPRARKSKRKAGINVYALVSRTK